MIIFEVLKHLYTSKDLGWLDNVEENDVQPLIVQRWLSCDDRINTQTRWLDKYVFTLSSEMYLSLAWSIIPKNTKMPFLKYISINRDEEELGFILKLVRKEFSLSDNDYKYVKDYLIKAIRKDMVAWFKYYGIERHIWKKYYLNFDEMSKDDKVKQRGLDSFGT